MVSISGLKESAPSHTVVTGAESSTGFCSTASGALAETSLGRVVLLTAVGVSVEAISNAGRNRGFLLLGETNLVCGRLCRAKSLFPGSMVVEVAEESGPSASSRTRWCGARCEE